MSVTCQDVQNALEVLAPRCLAESWDNVGLLLGHPAQMVKGVVVALDIDDCVIKTVVNNSANLIVAHHPVIFKSIAAIRRDTPQGDLLWQLVQHDIAVIAVHTNLDTAWGGVNDVLAELLNLRRVKPLTRSYRDTLYKIAVFVPASHAESVRCAMGEAGAGHIGLYSHCAFMTAGEGTFKPLAGSKPFIGRQNELEKVNEYKIETIVTEQQKPQVIMAMLAAHPYEEVAYDIYKLNNETESVGIGRIGALDQPMAFSEFAAAVKTVLSANVVKAAGDPDRLVQIIAVCGGSGAGFIDQAKMAGADVLVTADVKYHEAQAAASLGLALVDAGHFATEYPVVSRLADYLRTCGTSGSWDLPVITGSGTDVFWEVR